MTGISAIDNRWARIPTQDRNENDVMKMRERLEMYRKRRKQNPFIRNLICKRVKKEKKKETELDFRFFNFVTYLPKSAAASSWLDKSTEVLSTVSSAKKKQKSSFLAFSNVYIFLHVNIDHLLLLHDIVYVGFPYVRACMHIALHNRENFAEMLSKYVAYDNIRTQ